MLEQKNGKERSLSKDAIFVSIAIIIAGLLISASLILSTIIEKRVSNERFRQPTIAGIPMAQKPLQVNLPADTMNILATAIKGAPTRGNPEAPVTIVEFSDFQCPFCARAQSVLKQVIDTYPKDVRLVFKHRPLEGHQYAELAAKASIAAEKQGKFWEMHDILFANQTALEEKNILNYAKEIGLDMNKFREDLKSSKVQEVLDSDKRIAERLGIGGTPTFFINGKQIFGAKPYEEFKAIIEEELKFKRLK